MNWHDVIYITLLFLIFIFFLWILNSMQRRRITFSKRVFAGMGIGLILGGLSQAFVAPEALAYATDWIDIVGSGYVRLLQMIVMPLIFVSILSAVLRLDHGNRNVGRLSFTIIGILITTAIIAAGVGVLVANTFSLSIEGLNGGQAELARGEYLIAASDALKSSSMANRLLELIPVNIFSDFTGARSTSTIGIVIFASLLGVSSRAMLKRKMELFQQFKKGVLLIHDVIMELVKFILRLTPYGVMAMMFKIASTSHISDIMQLGNFIIASYVAIIIMFAIHLLMISFSGMSPVKYIKRTISVLAFAFSSRSSAATIPMNVKTQIDRLGVEEGVANLSASLGSSIGQNGCAAIYPAMLAVMIAPSVGVDPLSLGFIIELLAIVAISSFGVAGVGGGATFAALMVLYNLNFPVALVGLLISIEPLIDMGRTALNVNGSIVAGVLTTRINGFLKSDLDNQDDN